MLIHQLSRVFPSYCALNLSPFARALYVVECRSAFLSHWKGKGEREGAMLRRCEPRLNWRATYELDRVRNTMWGRAKLERKLGFKRMFFQLRCATKYRVSSKRFYDSSIIRRNVDAAAQEHGASWNSLRNDFARQNVILQTRSQQRLAQYEPLAFRSLVELAGSKIPPPPPPQPQLVPAEAYSEEHASELHPTVSRELREAINKILYKESDALKQHGPASAEGWMDVWKEFEAPASRARAASGAQ